MTATIIGSGPAVLPIETALTDTTHEIRSVGSLDELTGAVDLDLAIVVDRVGSDVFSTANANLRESGTPWIAVELGGIGGYSVPSVEASVSGFSPDTVCFDCLRKRIAANLDIDTEGDSETDTATDRFAGALAGRESVRVLSGSESPVLGGSVEIPHAIRRVLPVPNCECAGERDWTVRRTHDTRTLDDALGRAEQALDERVGLLREVGEIESFPVPYYLSNLSDTSGFSDVMGSRQAAGVALGWDEAFMKALGEGLERYCAGVYRTVDLHTARPADLSNANALAPSAFVRPTDDSDGRITWVPGENLSTEESVFLPASRVFFPYDAPGPTITTGLGLGNSGATALIAGLTEIIERDAALLAWYSTYEPLGLSIDDSAYETLVDRAGVEGLSVTATLLTQDIDVPVVGVSVHQDSDEWPAFAMGLACDLDPVDAARAACCEALQNWMELRSMGRTEAAAAGGRIGHFASRPASIEEFVSPETTIPASSVTDDVPTRRDALDALVRRVADAGLDSYAARLTTPDVEDIGFEAVRVLVPRAQPLFVDDPYFGERAETVPEELGFESRLRREHHPYP